MFRFKETSENKKLFNLLFVLALSYVSYINICRIVAGPSGQDLFVFMEWMAHAATVAILTYYSCSKCSLLRISSYRLMAKHLRKNNGAVLFNTVRFLAVTTIYFVLTFVHPSLDHTKFLSYDRSLGLRDAYFPYVLLLFSFIAFKQLFFGASFALGLRRRAQ